MTPFWKAHRALDAIARWPGVSTMLERRFDRRFASNTRSNLFRGRYATFEAAARASPSNRPVGYDNEAAAAMYDERAARLHATDYPVLFWLQQLFAQGKRSVFDLGGHVGVSYYAYRRVLAYPPGLTWTVCDVPAVIARGRTLAGERDPARALGFTDRFEGADGADILLAMGSLQYLPETLAERLSTLVRTPRHLLLNITPLHEHESFFTLQGIGTAYCPYRITARGEFLGSLAALGYELVDQWENPDKRCEIAFDPGHSIEGYCGFHLERRP